MSGEAAAEILRELQSTGNISWTEGRLSALMTSDSASAVVKDALWSSSAERIDLMKLWYMEHVGNWEGALEFVKKIDEEENRRGNEILRFATKARREGAYPAALRPYEYLMQGPQTSALAAAYG